MLSVLRTARRLVLAPTPWTREHCARSSERQTEVTLLAPGPRARGHTHSCLGRCALCISPCLSPVRPTRGEVQERRRTRVSGLTKGAPRVPVALNPTRCAVSPGTPPGAETAFVLSVFLGFLGGRFLQLKLVPPEHQQ